MQLGDVFEMWELGFGTFGMSMRDLGLIIWNDGCLTWNMEYGMSDFGNDYVEYGMMALVVEKWNME